MCVQVHTHGCMLFLSLFHKGFQRVPGLGGQRWVAQEKVANPQQRPGRLQVQLTAA